MGWFKPDTEKDAFRMIEKINSEMRAINASMHQNYNMIDGRNRSFCRSHFNNIISYTRRYESIKNNLSEMDRVMMMGATVDIWNGERDGVVMWEHYLRNTLEYLNNEINY